MKYVYGIILNIIIIITHNAMIIGMDTQKKTQNSSSMPVCNVNIYNTQKTDNTNVLTSEHHITMQQQSFQPLAESYATSLNTFIINNKYKIVGCIIASLYLYTLYTIINYNRYLKQDNVWGAWKQHMTFEELCTLPQKQLEQELIKTIQQRYINIKNPTDFVMPLVSFVQEIDAEIPYITRYITLCSILKRIHLTRLFPINDERIAHAEKRLQRISFIKHIFISWAAEYNIIHNKRSALTHSSKKCTILEKLTMYASSTFEKIRAFLWGKSNKSKTTQSASKSHPKPETLESKYFTSSSPNRNPAPKNTLALRLLTKSSAPNVT